MRPAYHFPDLRRTRGQPKRIKALAEAVQGCRACPLYKPATQGVFGEGSAEASIMLVGEQPGNDEDLSGHPFVGPAGKILDQALSAAGISRAELFVTNAVKHFKFEQRGKRRLHKRPNAAEVQACRPWYEHELSVVRPRLVICLGATAAASVLRKKVTIKELRGKILDTPDGGKAAVTIHPSALLRIPGRDEKARALARFVTDLKRYFLAAGKL